MNSLARTGIGLARVLGSVALVVCLAGVMTASTAVATAGAATPRWAALEHGVAPSGAAGAPVGQRAAASAAPVNHGGGAVADAAGHLGSGSVGAPPIVGPPVRPAALGRGAWRTLSAGLRAALAHLHPDLGPAEWAHRDPAWTPGAHASRPPAVKPSCVCGGGGPTYSQQAELADTVGASGDAFGYSVALSSDGNTALIGAPQDTVNAGPPGKAYVFVRSGASWVQQAELSASDGTGGDLFGFSVALSGDGNTALIGAFGKNVGTGAAYVFERSGSTWVQAEELTAADGASGDAFGYSVALSSDGTTMLIGAFGKNFYTGVVYVYVPLYPILGWGQEAELTASDGGGGAIFGASVALSGDGNTALIGAPGSYLCAPRCVMSGKAYLFGHSGGTWGQETELAASDAADGDWFGYSVALTGDGGTALIGAYEKNNGTGAAYVFMPTFGWTQQAELTASGGASGDFFGASVTLSSDDSTALIGAFGKNSTGATYVFEQSGNTWQRTQTLTASDSALDDDFGNSVASSGDGSIVLAGAYARSLSTGAAYIFSSSVTPTPTDTPLPPTNTPIPPTSTATNTPIPPTNTPIPTSSTPVPPTATNTPLPPTATDTPVPPTATNTPVPPTATPTNTPMAAVTLSRGSGRFADSIAMTGTNFGAGETIGVYLDSTATTALSSTTSTAGGAFVDHFSVPQAISGTHTLIARGLSSGRSAGAFFLVLPGAYLAHYQGVGGSSDILAGAGFAPHETVHGYWQTTASAPFTRTATTNSLGSFGLGPAGPVGATAGITFTVPFSPTGQYAVDAVGQSSHGVAHATFTLLPALSVKPASAPPGGVVTVAGSGFAAHETVTLKYNCGSSGCTSTQVLATPQANGSGAFSVPVTLPTSTSVGAHSIGGIGATSGVFATTTITIN